MQLETLDLRRFGYTGCIVDKLSKSNLYLGSLQVCKPKQPVLVFQICLKQNSQQLKRRNLRFGLYYCRKRNWSIYCFVCVFSVRKLLFKFYVLFFICIMCFFHHWNLQQPQVYKGKLLISKIIDCKLQKACSTKCVRLQCLIQNLCIQIHKNIWCFTCIRKTCQIVKVAKCLGCF